MAKFITTLSGASGRERASLQRRLLERDGPLLADAEPKPSRLIVDLVDVPPPAGAPVQPPRYDAVVEAWLEDAAAFSAWACSWLPAIAAAAAYTYHVSERVQLDDGLAPAAGERSPGIKVVYLVRRHAELSNAVAKQRWQAHAALARTHHAGMSRYLQNGVIRALAPDAPIVNGIAVLHFPSREDLERRMFDSAEGRDRIAADAAGLVAEATALYCSEWVLRA